MAVSDARKAALLAANAVVPAPVRLRALIDTGTSGTCIDQSVLDSLGLTPTGTVNVNTPSTGATPHAASQYDVSVIIPSGSNSHAPLVWPTIPVMAAELFQAQRIHALVGRDILGDCVLNYNGTAKLYTLAY